jgi:hypothetical protein
MSQQDKPFARECKKKGRTGSLALSLSSLECSQHLIEFGGYISFDMGYKGQLPNILRKSAISYCIVYPQMQLLFIFASQNSNSNSIFASKYKKVGFRGSGFDSRGYQIF